MRPKTKRYALGGLTTSMNVQRPAFASTFTQPSQPMMAGGSPVGGPPYFPDYAPPPALASRSTFKKGGAVKKKPKVSSASKRGDGCCKQGKTRGKMR
jgi:hypothetical protein